MLFSSSCLLVFRWFFFCMTAFSFVSLWQNCWILFCFFVCWFVDCKHSNPMQVKFCCKNLIFSCFISSYDDAMSWCAKMKLFLSEPWKLNLFSFWPVISVFAIYSHVYVQCSYSDYYNIIYFNAGNKKKILLFLRIYSTVSTLNMQNSAWQKKKCSIPQIIHKNLNSQKRQNDLRCHWNFNSFNARMQF